MTSWDEINDRCGHSSFEDPIAILANGYKVCFREYLPSPVSPRLVGVALGFKDKTSPYFYCLAGGDQSVLEYEKGALFAGIEDINLTTADPVEAFVAAKEQCVLAMQSHLETL